MVTRRSNWEDKAVVGSIVLNAVGAIAFFQPAIAFKTVAVFQSGHHATLKTFKSQIFGSVKLLLARIVIVINHFVLEILPARQLRFQLLCVGFQQVLCDLKKVTKDSLTAQHNCDEQKQFIKGTVSCIKHLVHSFGKKRPGLWNLFWTGISINVFPSRHPILLFVLGVRSLIVVSAPLTRPTAATDVAHAREYSPEIGQDASLRT